MWEGSWISNAAYLNSSRQSYLDLQEERRLISDMANQQGIVEW